MNKTLNKIADYLIFYNRRVRDIGLFHGKIGIVGVSPKTQLQVYPLKHIIS